MLQIIQPICYLVESEKTTKTFDKANPVTNADYDNTQDLTAANKEPVTTENAKAATTET
jgi:hypothetical protein